MRKVGGFYGFNWRSLDSFCFFAKSKTNKKMNKFTKAIAALMLTVAVIVVAGCKPKRNDCDEQQVGN